MKSSSPTSRPLTRLAALAALTGIALCAAPLAHAEEVQGIVQPVKEAAVASPIDDLVAEVLVQEGDVVKEGQPLAKLQNAKEQIEVQLYQKQMEQREFAAKGMESLLKENMVSKESALEKSTDREIARLTWELAKERLSDKTIKAPLAGIVVRKFKEPGEGVQRTEKMFELVNIDEVYIQFYLDPKFMVQIRPGMQVPVKIPVLGNNTEFTASVSFVDPRIDAASGLFRVRLLLQNANHDVKAGMRALADFEKLVASK